MVDKVFIINSVNKDVYKNLAYENFLLEYVQNETFEYKKTVAILFLWENYNTIVIGKNQNPYKECNIEYVFKNNIKIARRTTGGGAVYHDAGNINFSFIVSKNLYNKEEILKIITDAFKKLKISVELSGRNDILLFGKKISGNAYKITKDACLCHGTILISSDGNVISKCLTPNKYKIKEHSVNSVESRITNVIDIYPNITAEEVKKNIVSVFKEKYPSSLFLKKLKPDKKRIDELSEKYSSHEWIFSSYSDSGASKFAKYDRGYVEVRILKDENNKIKCDINSDTLDVDLIEEIQVALNGVEFSENAVKKIQKKFYKNIKNEQRIFFEGIFSLVFGFLNED